MAKRIIPVILSGGSGTRLWPLSREDFPKQFHALVGPGTLLQDTAMRVCDRMQFDAPIVIANLDHRFMVAEQLRSAGITDATIVLEPFGRNTGPAAVVAALVAAERDPEAIVLLMPADHVITNPEVFRDAIRTGHSAAEAGNMVLFGVSPTHPETGYGYISPAIEPAASGPRRIERFVEKPDRATAEEYCRQGFLWNSGIFLFSSRRMLSEFERFEPDLLLAVRSAVADAERDADFIRIGSASFAEVTAIAVDRAVMERTEFGVVLSSQMRWTDVGSWSALWEISPKDASMNTVIGDVHLDDVSGSYLRTDGPTVAAIGLQDLIVIASDGAILVAARSAQQSISGLVSRLRSLQHSSTRRSGAEVAAAPAQSLLSMPGSGQIADPADRL